MKGNYYLASYIRSFFEDHLVRRRNLSQNSIWSYRDAIKLLIQFVVQHTGKVASSLKITDIDEQIILNFLKHLTQKRGNSIQTCNQRLITFKSLFEYIAMREPLMMEHCKQIATIPLKRGALLPQISYLTKDEVHALIHAPDKTTWRGHRDHILLLYMYNTGSRVQEVVDAQVSWLSLENPSKVKIVGKGAKSRICPLWKDTAKALDCYLKQRSQLPYKTDHMFINRSHMPFSRSGIAYIINTYVRKASCTLPSLRNKKVTPHILRHTTAMHLLQSGVEINVIKSWLGHVSLSSTYRYVEIDLEMKSEALKTCEVMSQSRRRHKVAPKLLTWLESL
jgi:site-specific recombinase XerD